LDATNLATAGSRAAAYLIDSIAATLISLPVIWIPIIGVSAAGSLLLPYWLLRDITTRSLGKMVLGLRVVAKDGARAGVAARTFRNLPLAVVPALLIFPLFGIFLAMAASPIPIIEAILLFVRGRRFGDRIAGTSVVQIK